MKPIPTCPHPVLSKLRILFEDALRARIVRLAAVVVPLGAANFLWQYWTGELYHVAAERTWFQVSAIVAYIMVFEGDDE